MSVDKKFILVTGASKGFGRSIVLHWAKFCSPGSKILILARSLEGLQETESLAKKVNSKLEVVVKSVDCSKPDLAEYEELFKKEIEEGEEKYDSGLIFHNVGVVEPQGMKATELTDLTQMENYFRLNLFSVIILNSVFCRVQKLIKGQLFVINISSIASNTPICTWAYYCTGKASRRMFFEVMAKESPNIRVLNYSPGPMDTSAVERLRNDPGTTTEIRSFTEKGNILQPETSVNKLFLIIEKNKFENGTEIDYFDEF